MSDEPQAKKNPVQVVITDVKIPLDSVAVLVLKFALIIFLLALIFNIVSACAVLVLGKIL